jgi:hypothetical protein
MDINDKMSFDLIDALQSPILTHDTSWADTIPQRLLKVIPVARMASLAKHEELATLPEVTAFMYTRVAIAPLTGEWFEIYMHVSCKVCEDYFHEDHWQTLEAKKELSIYEQTQFLLPLRHFIYEKRRKALKERMKENKPAPQCKIENIHIDTKPEYKQLEILFS